jgi:hypothetical protein
MLVGNVTSLGNQSETDSIEFRFLHSSPPVYELSSKALPNR